MNSAQFKELYDKAHVAGLKAGESVEVRPMVVSGGGNEYYVSEGVCGFAWINVRPGNSSFARWLKKSGIARASYDGGVDIWVNEFNQSYTRKEAYAQAFVKVLRDNGISRSYAMSRLD